MNIVGKLLKEVAFIDRAYIDTSLFQNKIITEVVESKTSNPIYEYLRKIMDFNCPKDSKDKIMYASAKDEKNCDNYIIFLNAELMNDYTKNLEELKRNLLIDKYSIPVSYKSELSNKSSETQKSEGKDKTLNKIKYGFNIELSNSSQNTNIQVESFISDEIKEKIVKNVVDNFNKMNLSIDIIKSDSRAIKLAMENRIKELNKNNEDNKSNDNPKELKEFDEIIFNEIFKDFHLNEKDISFLLNLFFNVDENNENLITILKLCYNILIFNLIKKDEYRKIKDQINNSIKGKDLDNKKISDFYFIKVFNDINEIRSIYFSDNNNIKEINKYKKKIDSIKSLEENIDDILKKSAPFCISYKKIEYLLEKYFNSLNKKSEKVSNYLDGYCFEDEIRNIITMENENIVQLPNLYYIFQNNDITFMEYDLICLVKENEILNFNKSIFDRVSYIHNLKLLDNINDIRGLSLIFFEIKVSQHSTKDIAIHSMEKTSFLYPLLQKYLHNEYNIEIENCDFFFAHVFDSKFNPNKFGTVKINDIKTINKNFNNPCKFIFIHSETNVGQFNVKMLKKEINNQKVKINELNKETNEQKVKINELKKETNEQKFKINELEAKASEYQMEMEKQQNQLTQLNTQVAIYQIEIENLNKQMKLLLNQKHKNSNQNKSNK